MNGIAMFSFRRGRSVESDPGAADEDELIECEEATMEKARESAEREAEIKYRQKQLMPKRISLLKKRFILIVCAFIVTVAILAIALAFGLHLEAKNTPSVDPYELTLMPPPSSSVLGHYAQAAVTSDASECSEIGKKILYEKHGSAVDAAIATLLCIGVQNPHTSGIGGGSFMIVYDRTQNRGDVFDMRETAPGSATKDMFKDFLNLQRFGGKSIALPGEIQGYWQAHQKYGRVPWKELFQPSIDMCNSGFRIGKSLAAAMNSAEKLIKHHAGLQELLVYNETDQLKREGDFIKNRKLGATLKLIAEGGAKAFYNSSLTETMVEEIKQSGGIVTKEDFIHYKCKRKSALLLAKQDGTKLLTPLLPSGGPLLAFVLNVLDGYAFNSESVSSQKDSAVKTYHRIVEAFKFATAARTSLGDQDFMDQQIVKKLLQNFTSSKYGAYMRSRISDDITHPTSYYGKNLYTNYEHGSTHVNVLAPDGSAVSVTSSINYHFGSGIRGSSTGIIYNNQMADFANPTYSNDTLASNQPFKDNFIEAGKRPLSSMCPAILLDNQDNVAMVVGGAGGSKIITSVAQAIIRKMNFGEDIKQAIDARRLHHQLLPPFIEYEKGFPMMYIDGLKNMGHNTSLFAPPAYSSMFSAVNAIHRDRTGIYANCDYRRGGQPAGY